MAKHEGRTGMVGNRHGASNKPKDSDMHKNINGRMTGRTVGLGGNLDTSKPFHFTDKGAIIPGEMAPKVHNKFQHKKG